MDSFNAKTLLELYTNQVFDEISKLKKHYGQDDVLSEDCYIQKLKHTLIDNYSAIDEAELSFKTEYSIDNSNGRAIDVVFYIKGIKNSYNLFCECKLSGNNNKRSLRDLLKLQYLSNRLLNDHCIFALIGQNSNNMDNNVLKNYFPHVINSESRSKALNIDMDFLTEFFGDNNTEFIEFLRCCKFLLTPPSGTTHIDNCIELGHIDKVIKYLVNHEICIDAVIGKLQLSYNILSTSCKIADGFCVYIDFLELIPI